MQEMKSPSYYFASKSLGTSVCTYVLLYVQNLYLLLLRCLEFRSGWFRDRYCYVYVLVRTVILASL